MDTSVLRHPLIAQTIATLVAEGGGVVTYDQGMGGRETLIAAAAALAARTGTRLTVVESVVLHDEVRSTIAALHPTVQCTVLSAHDAAQQPNPAPGGVLAVHADQLRNPAVRRPLLDLARAAGHLLVARHAYSDTTLDDLAGSAHSLDHRAFRRLGPVPNSPGFVAAVQDFDAGLPSFTPTLLASAEPPEGLIEWQESFQNPTSHAMSEVFERKQRLIEQLKRQSTPRPAPDGAEPNDVADLTEDTHGIDFKRLLAEDTRQTVAAIEQRVAELCEQIKHDTQVRAAAPDHPRKAHQQDQAQSAAQQHPAPGHQTPGR
ncbi:hypothetical protein [Streptomyces sp. NPDC058861]|uniref:hypothetical protein n=1 Tax=Streptomyces sp. NPDC058861 TaxID=3346653 RepID=UPI0036A4FFD5